MALFRDDDDDEEEGYVRPGVSEFGIEDTGFINVVITTTSRQARLVELREQEQRKRQARANVATTAGYQPTFAGKQLEPGQSWGMSQPRMGFAGPSAATTNFFGSQRPETAGPMGGGAAAPATPRMYGSIFAGAEHAAREAQTPAQREMAARGMSPTYEPSGTARPEEAIIDTTDLRAFIHRPAPNVRGFVVQCLIERDKSGTNRFYPKYNLYIQQERRFVMTARKRKKSKTSNYLISIDKTDLSRDGDKYVGKLRSNFVGTGFTAMSEGESWDKGKADQPVRCELASIIYESNILGFKGPRKMTVIIPALRTDGVPFVFRAANEIRPGCACSHPDRGEGFVREVRGEECTVRFYTGRGDEVVQRSTLTPKPDKDGILERYDDKEKGRDTSDLLALQNKAPVWNEDTQSYVLNFNKRVTLASVKNFQIIKADNPDYIIMQFGRIGENAFTMDYQYPMTAFQAFAIALSSFDNKLACE